MEKFNNLLTDLNFNDSSTGICSPETTIECIDILNEFNISPIEITDGYILFSDGKQQFKLYYSGQWLIEKTFDLETVKTDTLQMLDDLIKDSAMLEIFGQLVTGFKNWIRIVKNKKYDTYYICLFIDCNMLEFNGSLDELKMNIKDFFNTISI